MALKKGTQMRLTSVTYTCDRCKEEIQEQRTGFYPSNWNRLTLFNIERNIEITKNKELCDKCSKELHRWLYPHQIEEPKEETKDAPA